MKTVSALFVLAAAGTAFGQVTLSPGVADLEAIKSTLVAGGSTNAIAASQLAPGARLIATGSSFNGSGSWGNGVGGAAPVSLDGGGAAAPHNGTFDGVGEAYNAFGTQLGDTWSTAEFSGTLPNGNKFVQLSFFSDTATPLDASGAGFPQIGMGAGVGFFVSEGQDTFDVQLKPGKTGFNFVSADYGFFDATGTFLGAAPASDFSDANGVGAIGFINLGGLAGVAVEQFIFIEYEIVPAPGAAALFGLAGIAGLRRRR